MSLKHVSRALIYKEEEIQQDALTEGPEVSQQMVMWELLDYMYGTLTYILTLKAKHNIHDGRIYWWSVSLDFISFKYVCQMNCQLCTGNTIYSNMLDTLLVIQYSANGNS